ncbi:MAG TPA: DNA ligase D [Candidatus Limnocylindria bacterium]|nr:DNA ligase D [Candidatus Limnocylindria bacterium]
MDRTTMSLTEYQRKRDFKRTPEPKGGKPEAAPLRRYVVHRHHATRLHWDVRLEMRGVLVSFAVPQGPPLEAGKRRLAVHTEDHPIEYLTFHGVIPDGYGAGTMTIWDTGTYDLVEENTKRGASEPTEYKVRFHGDRLTGEYVIVQTTQNEGRDWLMILHGTPPTDHPLDRRLVPMLATSADEPFDSPAFSYEPKWDGVRTLAFVDGGVVRLQTRNLLDCTAQYPEAHGIAEALTGAYQAIVDGEIVALDEKGVPSFQRLQPRMHVQDESAVKRLRKSVPVRFHVFDLLWLDGRDLSREPLRERQRLLESVVTPMGAIARSEPFVGTGNALFAAVREQGLEGIVAKRLDSPYTHGRSAAWIKIKSQRTLDCVIGGWTEGEGGRQNTLGSLLVGVYREGKLTSVGHVGTGFDERTLRDLLAKLKERESPTPPFASVPRVNRTPHWCLPELVCEVQYTELTNDGTLRQPSFRGLRPDIDPKDCVGVERMATAKKAQLAAAKEAAQPVASAPAEAPGKQARVPAVLRIDGREVKLTNLEKVLFPEDGYTKADLIRYYTEVSPYLVPWVKDRPLTLKPFPDGISGMSFYQKQKPGFTPKWIASWKDPEEADNDYILCNDLPTVVWLANYTAIEIHPRLARVDRPDHPDNVMIDLDPATGATWDDVKEVAAAVKTILDDMDLVGFPKTTGSRGIHVLVPIARRYTFEESRAFAQRIGEIARERLPKLVTLEFAKAKRRGIYIDYLQNTRGKTTAGPYSVRPIRRAPVSAPLRWEEIAALGRPDAFTIANMAARLAAVGDVLGASIGMDQKIPRAPAPAARVKAAPAKPSRRS